MNLSMTGSKDILTNREAVLFTLNPKVLLARLFGNRSGRIHPSPDASTLDYDRAPLGPIEVVEAITDNRLHLLLLIGEVVELLGQSLFNTNIFALFDRATREKVELLVLEGGESFLSPDQYELDRMIHWLEAETLPSDIRRQLLEMYVRLDDLTEVLASLSQVRWERLKLWSGNND